MSSVGDVRVRNPLTPQEIIELDRALIEAFASHRSLKNRLPAARYIKYSQLPALFAESFVIAGARKLFGSKWIAATGDHCPTCDYLIQPDERAGSR